MSLSVATGGLAELMSGEIKEIEDICPELTLEGIRIIWEKSAKIKRSGK